MSQGGKPTLGATLRLLIEVRVSCMASGVGHQ
jgi:hypothetical protein